MLSRWHVAGALWQWSLTPNFRSLLSEDQDDALGWSLLSVSRPFAFCILPQHFLLSPPRRTSHCHPSSESPRLPLGLHAASLKTIQKQEGASLKASQTAPALCSELLCSAHRVECSSSCRVHTICPAHTPAISFPLLPTTLSTPALVRVLAVPLPSHWNQVPRGREAGHWFPTDPKGLKQRPARS